MSFVCLEDEVGDVGNKGSEVKVGEEGESGEVGFSTLSCIPTAVPGDPAAPALLSGLWLRRPLRSVRPVIPSVSVCRPFNTLLAPKISPARTDGAGMSFVTIGPGRVNDSRSFFDLTIFASSECTSYTSSFFLCTAMDVCPVVFRSNIPSASRTRLFQVLEDRHGPSKNNAQILHMSVGLRSRIRNAVAMLIAWYRDRSPMAEAEVPVAEVFFRLGTAGCGIVGPSIATQNRRLREVYDAERSKCPVA